MDPLMLLNWTDKLGILSKVKDKLINNNDAAAEKLSIVILELTKIFQAIDREFVDIMSLNFDEQEDNSNERKTLLGFEGFNVSSRIDEARFHCHKILNIYHRYLRGWFNRVLAPHEQQAMEDLFLFLGDSDVSMVDATKEIEEMLSTDAGNILDMVDAKDLNGANQKVRDISLKLRPMRKRLKENIGQLQMLYDNFIEVSGAV